MLKLLLLDDFKSMISPQTQNLYKTLLASKSPLSAKELADKLDVLPNAVYRLSVPLFNMGLIVKSGVKFEAKPLAEGLSLFLLNQSDWFSQRFSKVDKGDNKDGESYTKNQQIHFSFIQSREELMRVSVEEINKSKKSVNLLRSGHEIPIDTMLALKDAIKRKVVVRMLVQDYSKENLRRIFYWKQNGILVKRTPLRYIRLMMYDSKIVYFMSYKHSDSGQDMGMKIAYPPFAVILSQLFEKWWEEGIKVA